MRELTKVLSHGIWNRLEDLQLAQVGQVSFLNSDEDRSD
jgi:hypothetical protein